MFPASVLDLHAEVFIDGTWVDLADRLLAEGISISHGRADETSRVGPATMAVSLKNEDGLLTPDDARSAWWKEWALSTPLRTRIGAVIGQELEVSEIVPTWPVGDLSAVEAGELVDLTAVPGSRLGLARAHVTASGIMRRLGQGQRPLRSPLYRTIAAAPSVLAHWSMEDGAAATEATSSRGDPPMAVAGLSMSSDSTVLGADALPKTGQQSTWLGRVVGMAAGPWVYEQVLSMPQGPDASSILCRIFDLSMGESEIVRWRVDLGFDGTEPTLRLVGSDGTGIAVVDRTVTSPPLFFGAPLVLRLERSGSSYSLSWYRGGASTILASGTYGSFSGLIRSVGGQVAGPSLAFGHIVISEESAGWLDAAFDGYQGEPAGERFTRLCIEEGVAYTVDGDTTATALMGPQRSQTLLDLLDECRASDLAILAETRSGPAALRFRTRRSRFNRPVAMALNASSGQIAPPFTPQSDDQTVRNDITVKRTGGGERQRVDVADAQPPPTGRGHYDDTVTISLLADDLLEDQAGWRLHMGTWKGMRYPQVTIDLAKAPGLIDAWLALEVGDRIQITNLPPQHPLGTVDLIVQGWTETLSPTSWTVALNCTPAGIWTVARWGISRYGFKGKTLAGAVNESATTLSVAYTGKPISTTPGAYAIRIGAEVLTLTGVSGSSSPQLVSVIRGVNGLPRTHPAGAVVELVDQPILAL